MQTKKSKWSNFFNFAPKILAAIWFIILLYFQQLAIYDSDHFSMPFNGAMKILVRGKILYVNFPLYVFYWLHDVAFVLLILIIVFRKYKDSRDRNKIYKF